MVHVVPQDRGITASVEQSDPVFPSIHTASPHAPFNPGDIPVLLYNISIRRRLSRFFIPPVFIRLKIRSPELKASVCKKILLSIGVLNWWFYFVERARMMECLASGIHKGLYNVHLRVILRVAFSEGDRQNISFRGNFDRFFVKGDLRGAAKIRNSDPEFAVGISFAGWP